MGGLSILVGGVAAACTGAGYLGRHVLPTPVLYVLAHAALTGYVVSLSASDFLCDRTGWILGKDRKTGQFNTLALAAFWPFHLGLHLRIRARRARSTEAPFHRVADGWYISGWPHEQAVLPPAPGGVAILDCTAEFALRVTHAAYLCLPTWDTCGVAPALISEGVDWALEQRALGRAVVVHCAHGHGRSMGVLAACLVASDTFPTYQQALAAAQAVRPRCKLNGSQVRTLEAYLRDSKKLA